MTRSGHTPAPPTSRMDTYRRRMRAAGLRPVQIWVPDTRSAAFAEICERQSRSIAAYDPAGKEIDSFFATIQDWPEP